MVIGRLLFAITLTILLNESICTDPDLSKCEAPARTEAGWVCGRRRLASKGVEYLSYRGVPYAKQPLGELRFKELQPLEPWMGVRDASTEGPVCPQNSILYEPVMKPHGMSEACIYANIHVPIAGSNATEAGGKGYPILVFVHGGSLFCGSGDTDLYGPEYLVRKGIIVITFNYRLDVFGFLSLGFSTIPGNNGLRDIVSLLKWVKRNARAFGGDPDEVTLGGHSAGAFITHTVAVSPEAKHLIKRVALLSGSFHMQTTTTMPLYSSLLGKTFVIKSGINPFLPSDEIHRQLVNMPLRQIMNTSRGLADILAMMSFGPSIESTVPNVKRILDRDPEELVRKGRSTNMPVLFGLTDEECRIFEKRFEDTGTADKLIKMPLMMIPGNLVFKTSPFTWPSLLTMIRERYFSEHVDTESLIKWCSDYYFFTPYRAMKMRQSHKSAPLYVYKFSYTNPKNPVRIAYNLTSKTATHMEDLPYVFRANSIMVPQTRDELRGDDDESIMRDKMSSFIANFVRFGNPAPGGAPVSWPAVKQTMGFLDIQTPKNMFYRNLTKRETSTVQFLEKTSRIAIGY